MIIHFLRISFLIGVIGTMDKHITVFLTVTPSLDLSSKYAGM